MRFRLELLTFLVLGRRMTLMFTSMELFVLFTLNVDVSVEVVWLFCSLFV